MTALTGERIAALEQEWIGRVQIDQPDVYFDWQPAGPALFTQLLTACLPHVAPGSAFVDVGCGIGTKCLLAELAGVAAVGFDRVPEYVAEANRLGATATLAEASAYHWYGRHGLVYVNHPLKGDAEAALERVIHAAMAPGSVLMAVNYTLAPGWREIARAGDWNAAWVKS